MLGRHALSDCYKRAFKSRKSLRIRKNFCQGAFQTGGGREMTARSLWPHPSALHPRGSHLPRWLHQHICQCIAEQKDFHPKIQPQCHDYIQLFIRKYPIRIYASPVFFEFLFTACLNWVPDKDHPLGLVACHLKFLKLRLPFPLPPLFCFGWRDQDICPSDLAMPQGLKALSPVDGWLSSPNSSVR